MRWLRFIDKQQAEVLVNVDNVNNFGVDATKQTLIIDNFYIEVPLSKGMSRVDVLARITDELAKYTQDNSVIDMRWLSKD